MKGALYIASGTHQQVVPLKYGHYFIGRDEEVEIQIESRKVSRRHAEIIVDELGVQVIDLGSANGTELNGEQVTEKRLRDGDRIAIGGVVLTYRSYEDESKSSRIQQALTSLSATAIPSIRPRRLRTFLSATFAIAIASVTLLTGLSYRTLMMSRLEEQALHQGQNLVRLLAERNREDLRLGNELLLDVDSVRLQPGVVEALILDTDKKILAPISRLHQIDRDPFVSEALSQETDQILPPSPEFADSSRIFVQPIRAYDENTGSYKTLGVAKLVFSPAIAAGSMRSADHLLILVTLAGVLLAMVLGWGATRIFSQPLDRLAERLHQWRIGQPCPRDGHPFTEWASLFEAVDRIVEEEPK